MYVRPVSVHQMSDTGDQYHSPMSDEPAEIFDDLYLGLRAGGRLERFAFAPALGGRARWDVYGRRPPAPSHERGRSVSRAKPAYAPAQHDPSPTDLRARGLRPRALPRSGNLYRLKVRSTFKRLTRRPPPGRAGAARPPPRAPGRAA